MQEHKTIQEYLETAAAQIRWKRARSVVMPELRRHLEDQRDAFAAEGHEDAEGLAVEEMGDPVTVGTELDSIHHCAIFFVAIFFFQARCLRTKHCILIQPV